MLIIAILSYFVVNFNRVFRCFVGINCLLVLGMPRNIGQKPLSGDFHTFAIGCAQALTCVNQAAVSQT
jgi:hypothetical protein